VGHYIGEIASGVIFAGNQTIRFRELEQQFGSLFNQRRGYYREACQLVQWRIVVCEGGIAIANPACYAAEMNCPGPPESKVGPVRRTKAISPQLPVKRQSPLSIRRNVDQTAQAKPMSQSSIKNMRMDFSCSIIFGFGYTAS